VSRAPRLRPGELDDAQLAVYQDITQGARAQGPRYFDLTGPQGELLGPFNGFLLSPRVGAALSELGAALRFSTGLTRRSIEIVILTTAAAWDSAFERDAHEAVGRGIGLSEACLRDLRHRQIPELSDAEELACAELALALSQGDVDDDIWRRSESTLGATRVFEISSIVGYYSLLALQLRLFRADH
jgi:4-carboxymuconolactone decarboxylase